MTEFKREFFKVDPVFSKLHEILKRNHEVAEHTKTNLFNNRHIKDFCEEARHFIVMPGLKPIYLHYDCASWLQHPDSAAVKIESIGVYDDFMEYESARIKQLHNAKNADIPNIN